MGALLAGIWYGAFGGQPTQTIWAEEMNAPASKAAETPDTPDEPPDLPEKPAPPEAEKPAPKAPEAPGAKEAAPPSAPSPKEKGQPEPKPPGPAEAPAPGKQVPTVPKTPGPAEVPAPGKQAPTVPKTPGPGVKGEPVVEWPVQEELRKNRTEVTQLLRSGTWSADQEKMIRDYYTHYGLARWTQVDKRAEVRKYRDELLSELRQAEGKAHDQTVEIVMELLTKMAEGNHAPVARVNAILAVGELNQVEPKPGRAPEPLPAAQSVLLRVLQNPNTPDAIRVAALVGWIRHAELGVVPDPMKLQVAGILTALAQDRTPSSRSAAGHAWLRSLAIDALAALKTPGQNGQVVLTLIEVLADETAPLGVRTAAAQALGNLDYSQGFPGDLNKAVQEMGQVALDALQKELEEYKKDKKLVSRRLQTYLIGVYNGLSGLEKVAAQSADRAALHKQILEAVRACLVTLENPKLRGRDAEIVNELTKQAAALNESVSGPVAVPSPTEKPKT